MKRVLVTGAAKIGKAGVATIVYKWGQEFNTNEIVYDYLMQSGMPEKQYVEAIQKKGGRIYTMESESPGVCQIIKWVEKIIEDNCYEVLHINSDSAYVATAYIIAAKRAGLKQIYVHSHCTQIDDSNTVKRMIKTIIHRLCIPYVNKNTKLCLACSNVAGEWMFGKKKVHSTEYRMIKNGVEAEKYLFNENYRNKLREELGVSESFVIGNIGRLSYQKNQNALIDIFNLYHKSDSNSVLLIVGEGELKNELEIKINKMKLKDKVLLLGIRNDIPKLLSAFDVMVMPSRFEGLPVTMVEAQMADLPCVVSDCITREADFTGIVQYVNNVDEKEWVRCINTSKEYKRDGHIMQRINSDFNVKNAARELEQILLSDV